jgi:hypothetical protein
MTFRENHMSNKLLAFALCLSALQSPWAQSQELPRPTGQSFGPIPFEELPDPSSASTLRFGESVALSGNTALAGMPGFQLGIGRVAVFRRDEAGVWHRAGSLENPTGEGGFGSGVGLAKDFALVGFSNEDTRGSYVYRRTNHGLRLLRSLAGSFSIDKATGRLFTTSVAADGSWIIRFFELEKRGRLHKIDRFTIPAELTADELRRAAIWDDLYVLTNPRDNESQGAAYVFEKLHGRWRLRQKLIAADGNAGDLFGYSVAVHGETIVIGAVNADRPPSSPNCFQPDSGAVYVFKRRNGLWSEDQKLDPVPDPNCVPNFGNRLIFSGKVLLAQDNRGDTVESLIGWHIFERQFGQYQLAAYLLTFHERFAGSSFDIERSTVIYGLPSQGCCDETGHVSILDLTP